MTDREILEELKNITRREIAGCQIKAENGITMYTPDGTAQYDALYCRDFAYMLMYAPELMDKDNSKACLECLFSHVREDGWMPDKVRKDGMAVFTAGDGILGEANLDNAQFAVLAADACMKLMEQKEAEDFFRKWHRAMSEALFVLPHGENGLVYNDPVKTHSPYGFSDTIGKTGFVAMESLLLWQALGIMSSYARMYSLRDDYAEWKQKIEDNFACELVGENGMLYGGTIDCRQTDVWSSAYAVFIDFPFSEAQKDNISRWILDNLDGICLWGQIRHTAPGEYWQRLLLPEVNTPEEYQNGAYWATPSGWTAVAAARLCPEAGLKIIRDAYSCFVEKGTYECINKGYAKCDHYVNSVSNVYGGAVKLVN